MIPIAGLGGQSRFRSAQEREFFKYVPSDESSSHFAPIDAAGRTTFTPVPSRDSALTSFAQLGAFRLGTQRAIISLFDRTHQHVLAEATPSLSLVGGKVANDQEHLRLGCCVFPKARGLCNLVSGLSSSTHSHEGVVMDKSAVVISDIPHDDPLRSSLLAALSDVHFYAGVPIISPRGFIIGAYSVIDTRPRPAGVDGHSIQFMKDMAATVMEHLEMQRSEHKNRQAERMIVGLGSFVEGRATLRDSWREATAQQKASEHSGEKVEGQLNMRQQGLQEAADGGVPVSSSHRDSAKKSQDANGQNSSNDRNTSSSPDQRDETAVPSPQNHPIRARFSGDPPEEDSLTGIKLIFSRAANLIRESIEAEGVVFLGANSQRFGSVLDRTSRQVSGIEDGDSTSSGDESTDVGSAVSKPKNDGGSSAFTLGYATSRTSSINDESAAGREGAVPELLLTRLLRRYPHGQIFTYNADGSVSDDSDNTSGQASGSDPAKTASSTGSPFEKRSLTSKKRGRSKFRQDALSLIRMFPDARHILLVPVWDFDRTRCFAGSLIWTNTPARVFSAENELVYVSSFANNIMAEIRRLDVEMAEKAETNLVSSISHELRNPLHGILGTADILSDTAMNALQHGMVHTIESCGRTLLDTINNLLDLTFINKFQAKAIGSGKNESAGSTDNQMNKSNDADKFRSYSRVNLDSVLEEVAECVFAGYSFYHHPQQPPPALVDSSSRTTSGMMGSKPLDNQLNEVTVIFDIQYGANWEFFTHAGAWRRILMNVLGNALKYTNSGYIYLGLKSSSRDQPNSAANSDSGSATEQLDQDDVVLTVKDTGKGISPEYLQNDLFRPFSQENPLAAGSGLGLSIVRQAVGSIGGSIDIVSARGEGTEMTIRTALRRYPMSAFSALRRETVDKSIGILGFGASLSSQRDITLYEALERMCREWFGLKVTSVSPVGDEVASFDFYLAVQTELDSEDPKGRDLFSLAEHTGGGVGHESPVVVICQYPEVAHNMFVAAKVREQTGIFEFISQPCGPRKLARALSLCIKRRTGQQTGGTNPSEHTRWVEMPESSRLPLDISAADAPSKRLPIHKRPTTDTMGTLNPQSAAATDTPTGESHQQLRVPSSSVEPAQQRENDGRAALLVDDNDLNLQLLTAYARKENREYMTAQDGQEAVDTYKAHPGKFCVVLLDISMPVMDGFDAAREMRRFDHERLEQMSESDRQSVRRTIIAGLTGLDGPAARKEAASAGIDTFLVKPVKGPDVRAILRQIDQ
ncbi:hypothetical protein P168DRAFT_299605 [Aspergillus campestris IBT 28561]|uniref:histidine kinase n=1 Tax=Aspergillus campestris (strain IBT 28561) TaxID=1392248 RepID=A0A2I1CST5_ASPC2|nr:uncharacterized protein P168DRAFT_299605 [Aspergillus campestris IBT 28561]PKY00690.1 hypothetical protein P168DRAFT_299605 [Aspergillus campestris IBT 28561]